MAYPDNSRSIRGGAVDSRILRERTCDDDAGPSSQLLRQRRGMRAALAATYFSVMASKCALPAVLAQLTSPKIGLKFSSSWTSPQQVLFARLLAISTIAIATGKLLLGPVIDYFGGIFSLKVALSLLAMSLGIISAANSFLVFAVSWVVVDFVFSSCWAACINAIHQSFPENEWAQSVGMLASAARTGNAAAFAFFAWILGAAAEKINQPWRVVFAASALIQGIPLFLLFNFGSINVPEHARNNIALNKAVHKSEHQPQTAQITDAGTMLNESLATLKREAQTPTFWLQLVSRSVLMVFASFLLFVPLLMNQAYGASPATSAQVGSIYALGCLLSVTFGSNLYARLSYKEKALSVGGLLTLATAASAAQLGHMAGAWKLSTSASAAWWFIWGYSFSIPFYLPPSLYALTKGGVDSSATIADVFDIGGFGLLAIFNGWVASINHAKISAWITTFQVTTACAAIALICLTASIILEGKSPPGDRKTI